ncbi:sulfite oxidase heme-binding subunit YedZ [Uliginosibacterium gangwonense]|uniref:sulfite oxidase heme-binding subunit YedZ n=1 Tax=Uliginosibacterium gangwonense TaxID=392736 RepID=UPI000364BA49|nr:protein-methionine-sulfoxide reductase heme-binding subunit MsrQ [Uliginosibacterium gangwonense]
MRAWLKTPSRTAISLFKIALFLLCLIPLTSMAWRFYTDSLGANPIEAITHGTGDWALRLLLASLTITPLRQVAGLPWLMRLRRMLGLYAFFYALLHFTTYLWLDQFFDWAGIAHDILKRPFITVGFAAFVLLVPLAATSFNAAIRALGGRKWQALHRSVYAIGILSVVHYWWLVKRDITQPAIYAFVLIVLLGARAWQREKERRRQLRATPLRRVIPINLQVK